MTAAPSSLLQKQNAKYNEFCETNDLRPLRDRLKIAHWDRKRAAAARGAAKKYIPPKVSGGKLEKGSQEWYDKRNQEAKEYYERVRGTDDVGAVAEKLGEFGEADGLLQ